MLYEALKMQHELAESNYEQKLGNLDSSLKETKSEREQSVRDIDTLQSSKAELVRLVIIVVLKMIVFRCIV